MYMMTGNRQNMGENLWNSLFAPFAVDLPANRSFRVDIREKDDSYELEAELPGVSEDHISVQVDEDVLTIAADVNMDRKAEEYMHSERRWGHMERSFQLEGVDQDGITASLENGVLKLTLPKMNVRRPEVRKIAIGHGGDNTPKLEQGSVNETVNPEENA